MFVRVCVAVLFALLSSAAAAAAQPAPASAPKPWHLTFGAGLALTSGNKDTSTYNASYNVTYTPHARRTFKSDALLLRGKTNGELSNERFGLNVREEVRVGDRVFVFGQNQYLRDRFKRIQYMVAPTGGVGLTTVKNVRTTLTLDVGAGGVWEKNPYVDVRTSGALTFGQKLSQVISGTTTLTQSLSGLWKTEDLADAYFQFGAAVSIGVNSRVQLKVEVLDTYSNKPTGSRVEKNDISTVFAVVFKH
jgi:putative salt-induced outer membrane protein YdiY